MNLVKLIQDQVSGGALGDLSSLLGADEEATERATGAAVPALLAGLAGLAGNEAGAKKLSTALGSFEGPAAGGSFAQLLGGDPSSLLHKGTGLVNSLLGSSFLDGAAQAIGRFTGLSAGTVRGLLGYLTPLVMGLVGKEWKSRGGTPQALTNLFTEQKQNIASAVPAGFSLGSIPGLSAAQDAVRSAGETTRRAAASAERTSRSVASWAIPLLVLAVGGWLLWSYLGRDRNAGPANPQQVTALKPAVPEVPTLGAMTESVTGMFQSLGEALGGITNAASAEAALPKLEELNGKIDSIDKMIAPMPQDARTSLQTLVDDRMGAIKDQATKALAAPGISAKVREIIEQIVRKLDDWKIAQRAG
jgi:hypothetical protein